MRKIYLIVYNNETSSEVLKDRIKNVGQYYNLFVNNWLVKSHLQTCKEVYQEITKEDMNTKHLVVFSIDSLPIEGYWGFANNALWEWIKE